MHQCPTCRGAGEARQNSIWPHLLKIIDTHLVLFLIFLRGLAKAGGLEVAGLLVEPRLVLLCLLLPRLFVVGYEQTDAGG